jgi:hypothetical protein
MMKFNWPKIYSKQLWYGVIVFCSLFVVFGFLVYVSDESAGNTENLPSPSPQNLSELLKTQQQQRAAPQQQVQGAHDEASGPNMSQITPPSPSPVPSPSPAVTPTPTPTATPTSTPTPTPTPASQSNPTPTPAPSVPSLSEPTSTCEGSTLKINLSWSSVSNASSYKILKNSNAISNEPATNTYTDSENITAGNAYTYSVKAKGPGGDSGYSEPKSITPQPCPSP